MKANTRNIIKVSALSAALAACTVMSAVCVISTLNYQAGQDATQSTTGGETTSNHDTPAPVQLNQCVDAAAINCVHLPDDQSHAYYVNVGGHQWVYDGDTPADNAGEYLGNGYYQTFNPYQAVNAAGDSVALGDKFSADVGN